ncbi:RDD family protein [Rappaport israeli]|uniref:RDD family protein n=1 Tax=Rappaport israeli TaxID=1839807 RepID=UPI001177D146|nr:RDD family protein [Rappaport israeli]
MSAVLADPIARMWALVVDLLVMFGVLLGCLMLVVFFRSQATLGVVLVLVFVVSWGYFFLLEFFWRGQSLGKRLLGLQVVSEDLSALRLSQCAWRNVLRYLDFLPGCFGLGLCCMLFNGRNQRLGDWMAGTVVIVRDGGYAWEVGGGCDGAVVGFWRGGKAVCGVVFAGA